MKKKVCSKCKKKYPANLIFFKPDKNGKDGLYSYCRFCKRLIDRFYSRKYREKNKEWKKQDNKNRLSEQNILIREYQRKYPERKKATSIVYWAVKKGILLKEPCVICGKEKSQGHHEDYSKPLDVIWLCSKHHKELHFPLVGWKTEVNKIKQYIL